MTFIARVSLILCSLVMGGSIATSALAQTAGMERRQDRRDDRQDCRQQEGIVGGDKRDCKQEGRATRGDDPNATNENGTAEPK